MINKVIILGRLGKDPELRFTAAGKAVCNFTVATESTWKDKDGAKKRQTEWHRIQAWGPLAEICGKYLTKGREVFVEGELRTRSYDDKDGTKRYVTEIVAKEVKFLGGNGERRDDSRESAGTDAADRWADEGDAPF